MLDTIFIGMSGLTGYSKGLRVIGNNLTNVNTPGFKGSQLQFADLFYQGSTNAGSGSAGGSSQLGMGLNTLATAINFKAGDLRQTGGNLDLAIDGEGFFVLNDDGESRYTRAGQFQFDNDGFLVSSEVIGALPQIVPKKHKCTRLWQSGMRRCGRPTGQWCILPGQ